MNVNEKIAAALAELAANGSDFNKLSADAYHVLYAFRPDLIPVPAPEPYDPTEDLDEETAERLSKAK